MSYDLDEFKPLEFFLLCSLEDEEIDREKKVEYQQHPRLAARGLSGVLLYEGLTARH